MNREQHYREAEKRLTASDWQRQEGSMKTAMHEVAMAHVHALLANANVDTLPTPTDETPVSTEALGDLVRNLRERQHASQENIATAMTARGFAWHQATVYKIETSQRNLRFDEAAALAAIFGVSLDVLANSPAVPADGLTLGQAVVQRRTELRLSQEQIAEMGGPAVSSLWAIEGDKAQVYRPKTLRSLDIALGWEPGTAQRILTASTETGGAA